MMKCPKSLQLMTMSLVQTSVVQTNRFSIAEDCVVWCWEAKSTSKEISTVPHYHGYGYHIIEEFLKLVLRNIPPYHRIEIPTPPLQPIRLEPRTEEMLCFPKYRIIKERSPRGCVWKGIASNKYIRTIIVRTEAKYVNPINRRSGSRQSASRLAFAQSHQKPRLACFALKKVEGWEVS